MKVEEDVMNVTCLSSSVLAFIIDVIWLTTISETSTSSIATVSGKEVMRLFCPDCSGKSVRLKLLTNFVSGLNQSVEVA